MFEEIEISVETSYVLRKEVTAQRDFGGAFGVLSADFGKFLVLLLMFLWGTLEQKQNLVKSVQGVGCGAEGSGTECSDKCASGDSCALDSLGNP
jgi:hypothetical protein